MADGRMDGRTDGPTNELLKPFQLFDVMLKGVYQKYNYIFIFLLYRIEIGGQYQYQKTIFSNRQKIQKTHDSLLSLSWTYFVI